MQFTTILRGNMNNIQKHLMALFPTPVAIIENFHCDDDIRSSLINEEYETLLAEFAKMIASPKSNSEYRSELHDAHLGIKEVMKKL